MAALDNLEPGAPRVRESHIDWAQVGAWAAGTGLCLAVWTAVFLLIWSAWHV